MLDIRISTFSSDIVKTAEDLSLSKHPRALGSLLETRIAELNSRHESWGFKDPRTCMTYRAWKRYLPEHRVLVSFRNPYEVAAHLARSVRNIRMLKRIGRTAGGLNSWYLHNRNIMEYCREGGNQFLFIDYNKFMSGAGDNYIGRISEFCGREIRDLRDSNLYRNRMEKLSPAEKMAKSVGSLFIAGRVEELYSRLKDMEESQS
ncbi:MAG: sulfotransferase, partial [Candidatus Krumholzibacteriota bacterium]